MTQNQKLKQSQAKHSQADQTMISESTGQYGSKSPINSNELTQELAKKLDKANAEKKLLLQLISKQVEKKPAQS